MDPSDSRSEGVTATTATLPATADRALDFDALYRESRDDVFAYAATLSLGLASLWLVGYAGSIR